MKTIWLLTAKDFKRKWRNPIVILGFLSMPVLFTFILGAVFGTSGEPAMPQIKVLLTDLDKSLLSEFLSTSLTQGELGERMQIEEVSEEKGRERMNKGRSSALVIIPENFGRDVLEARPTQITLVKNPSEQFLPEIIQEICDISTLLLSSLFSVFENEIDVIRAIRDSGEFSDDSLSNLSIQAKKKIEGISKYVFPPVISIKQETIAEELQENRDEMSFQGYILPGMSLMFLLFISNFIFEDLLREKESGTLLRMTVSPMNISQFIWSKILTAILFGVFCTLILIVLGRIIFSIKWGNPVAVLLLVISLNLFIAGFISALYPLVRTERQAGAMMSSVILFMSVMGGSMLPVQFFPRFLSLFSKLTVNHWGIQAFYRVMRNAPAKELLPYFLGMSAIGIIFAAAGAHFLKFKLQKGLYK